MATAMSVLMLILKVAGGLIGALILLMIVLGAGSNLLRSGAAPTGDMIAVDGDRRLHCICKGPESAPLVLYDAGAFGIYTDGWWLLEELSKDHRICLYDRAGMGWSDPPPDGVRPDPDWHVEDMRRLRQALGQDDPFVLIGHSMAGIRLHAYANAYPEELRGLVFVDAARPQTIDPARIEQFVPWMSRILSVSGFFARIGVTSGVALFMPDELDLPADQARDKRRSIAAVSHHKATKTELLAAAAAWPDASWRSESRAEELPVFVFTNSAGGGANGTVADASISVTGIGNVTVLPDESHVSLLNQTNALLIARDVRTLTQGPTDD